MCEWGSNKQTSRAAGSSIYQDLCSIKYEQQYEVGYDDLVEGKPYHFSLDKLCYVGVFESKKRIRVNDPEEWLIRLRCGTLIIERQIQRIRRVYQYEAVKK